MAKELLASFFRPPPEFQQSDLPREDNAEKFMIRELTADEIESTICNKSRPGEKYG